MLCANRLFTERNTPPTKRTTTTLTYKLGLGCCRERFSSSGAHAPFEIPCPHPDTIYQMVSIGLCVCCLFVCPAYCENNIVHISIYLNIYLSGVYLLIAAFGAVFPILSRIGPEVIVPLECRNSKLHSMYFAHS